MAASAPKTFLITGVSSGLGRAFADAALAAGHRVVGTVRHDADADAFAAEAPDRAFPLVLDVTDYDAIPNVVAHAERRAGAIDVLVNNAGYGHEGVLEESSVDDLQRQFAANVFGPVAMMKAVLPGMRERRRGHIINVTSMGGFITMPGISFYCGSKFALEGISEALGKEVAGFGIRVTALAPGQFRTDWAGRSMDRTPRSIADYDAVMNPIRVARQAKSGNQPGDPDRAAKALLSLVAAENTPVRLFLGEDALGLVDQSSTPCAMRSRRGTRCRALRASLAEHPSGDHPRRARDGGPSGYSMLDERPVLEHGRRAASDRLWVIQPGFHLPRKPGSSQQRCDQDEDQAGRRTAPRKLSKGR